MTEHKDPNDAAANDGNNDVIADAGAAAPPDEQRDPARAQADSEPQQDSTSTEGGDEESDEPRVVDESAWAEGDGDDDDDDEVPSHFGAVAADGVVESEVSEAGEVGSADAERDMRTRPDVELTMATEPELPLALIDEDALWVVKRLRSKGFEAYLTGGCVRDLLLGRTPKDFDVATAAHPNQVRAVFRNCRLVGRRFRLAHVFFPSGKVIETATFRANPIDTLEDLPDDLLVARDNIFGNVEEDARRRDLTINGLFYDPVGGKVLDFVNGKADLEAKLIRTIGEPDIRFQEDPVRILRAIKFATRLGFTAEPATWDAMRRHVGGLVRCAPARLQEELLRLLTSGQAAESWDLCARCGVTQVILPELYEALDLPLEARAAPPQLVLVAPEADPSVAPTPEGDVVAAEAVELSHNDVSDEVTEKLPMSPAATTTATPVAAPVPMSPADRHARFAAVLASLDEVRRREADITSAVAFAALLVPVWEAFQASTTSFDAWWGGAAEKWIERLRFTRHDKERVPQLLQAQLDLEPERRRGHHARAVVTRPSFREGLMLLIVRLHAAKVSLDDVALWKAVARAHGANYSLPRLEKNRMRAASRAGGGSNDGRRRGRSGGGGGGGDRGRGGGGGDRGRGGGRGRR
ncbi:MAG: poly(A) polymerase [Deltaproteobacteria bacterium]|nr:poly(A) polymerase [Deltaproteobacteria bacterium]